jgi:apolipoprotein D and lipocalin family protein
VLPHSTFDSRAGFQANSAGTWRSLMLVTMIVFGLLLAGCSTTPPANVTPVTPFELSRYLGQWHEIARLDHSFERDMIKVTAQYSMNPDGSVKVLNRGFNTKKQAWKDAVGKAWLIDGPDKGALKVSFFGPFYGGYFITALDPDYQWAMVVGPDVDYFWILARQSTIDEGVKSNLLKQARTIGIAVDDIIWVAQ